MEMSLRTARATRDCVSKIIIEKRNTSVIKNMRKLAFSSELEEAVV